MVPTLSQINSLPSIKKNLRVVCNQYSQGHVGQMALSTHNNYLLSGNLELRMSDVTATSKFSDKKVSFCLNSAERI
jgi:hypothetical protein